MALNFENEQSFFYRIKNWNCNLEFYLFQSTLTFIFLSNVGLIFLLFNFVIIGGAIQFDTFYRL